MDDDLDEIVSDEIIRREYYRFALTEDIKEDLEKYLQKRNDYFVQGNMDSWIELKMAFDNIYHNTKCAYHIQIMSEADFFRLTGLLRQGVYYCGEV